MPNNFPLVESTECLFNGNQILRKLPDIIFPLSLRNLYICHHFFFFFNDRFHCESGNCGRSFLQFHNVAINGMITIIIFEILFLTRFCESYKYHCNHSAIAFETCLFFFYFHENQTFSIYFCYFFERCLFQNSYDLA